MMYYSVIPLVVILLFMVFESHVFIGIFTFNSTGQEVAFLLYDRST